MEFNRIRSFFANLLRPRKAPPVDPCQPIILYPMLKPDRFDAFHERLRSLADLAQYGLKACDKPGGYAIVLRVSYGDHHEYFDGIDIASVRISEIDDTHEGLEINAVPSRATTSHVIDGFYLVDGLNRILLASGQRVCLCSGDVLKLGFCVGVSKAVAP